MYQLHTEKQRKYFEEAIRLHYEEGYEEDRIAVKLPPEVSIDLRERHAGVRPAYHMNKKHWSDLYLDQLPDDLVKAQISASFHLVSGKAKKANHL